MEGVASNTRSDGGDGAATDDGSLKQIFVMGFCNFLLFSAFNTVQALSSKIYAPVLNSYTLSALYLSFGLMSVTLTNKVVDKLGNSKAIGLGILCYTWFMVCGYIYILGYFGTKTSNLLVMSSGVICGLGSALFWNAQGRHLLTHSNELNRGSRTSVIWVLFSAAPIFGSGIALLLGIGDGKQKQLDAFFVFFIITIVASGCSYFIDGDEASAVAVVEGVLPGIESQHDTAPLLATNEGGLYHTSNREDVRSEKGLMNNMVDRAKLYYNDDRAVLLMPLFFYTGLYQPYALTGFTRLFTVKDLASGIMMYYASECLGGIVVGAFLNGEHNLARKPYIMCGIVLLMFTTVLSLSIYVEVYHLIHDALPPFTEGDVIPDGKQVFQWKNPSNIYVGYFIFSLFGACDAVIQSFMYWSIGYYFCDNGSDEGGEKRHAAPADVVCSNRRNDKDNPLLMKHVLASYNGLQSLGFFLGMLIIPSKVVLPHLQVIIILGYFLIALSLFFYVVNRNHK